MKKKLLTLVSTAFLLGTSLASPVYATNGNSLQGELVKEELGKFQGFDEAIMETEPNNSFEEAMTVNDIDHYGGHISSGDQDFYKFTVAEKGMFYVYDGVFAEESYVTSSIYNEAGELLSDGEVADANGGVSNYLVVEPGTYYISYEADPTLSGEQEYFFGVGTYQGSLQRISGEDRYDTAVEIANRYALLTDNIILATGQDFPDALAAGPLSVQMDAPILLTRKTLIPESVKEFISYAEVKNVTIIGGTEVISQDIENYLKNKMGLNVERIAGINRFDTAAKIADRLVNVYGEKTAYVVNGRNFPDALSISPVAGEQGAPILLTESDSIPQATLNKVSKYDEFFVIGGPSAVSEKIASQLGTVTRISGENRYETSARVAEFFDYLSVNNEAYIATGANFADALTGAPIAAYYTGPLLLTPPNYLHEDAKNYIKAYDVIMFTIFGGKSAVSETVENELRSFIE